LSAATAVTPGIAVAQDSTGVLMVRVYRHVDSTPVSGAFVRSGRVAAITDRAGVGRVELAARLSSVTVTHPQFEPYTFEMTIEPNVAQRADIYLGAVEGLNGGLGVTRSGGKVADEPMAVRILDPGEVAAARQRHPGDLGGLFRGPRLRLQATSGTLEAARLRLNGLPGQYHGVLIDGLPLLGPRPGSYGLAQLGLGDLVGVEVLPASSTALYGPTFGSGVVNLISRPADRDRYQLGLDQSSEKGGDVFFWGARRFSPRTGGSLFADFHQQRLVDADDDGWGEFTRAIRFSIRPRFQWDHPNGDGLRATIGGVTEDRTGGLLVTSSDPNPYREELRTRRIDLGVAGHRLEAAGGRWEAKLATVFQSSSYRFDALRERDRRSFLFGELSYRRAINRVTLTAGLGYQREAFRQRDFPAFDYTHEAPAGFARAIIPISARAVAAAAVRCDRHSVHGAQCWSSGAVLLRPNRATEGRFSIGEGYVAPTPLSDEVETIGLHTTLPVNAKAERIRTASIDVRISEGPLVMAASLGYSRVALPVRLIPFPGDPEGRLRLINVSEPTRVFTGELTAELSNGPMSGRAFYSYQNGSEGVPDGTGRRDLDLTPRHTVGLDLTWLAPVAAGGAATLELAYVGAQAVHDNPFLTRTPGYPLIGGTASVRSGRGRLFLSGENLLDKKLADYHPVLLPTLAAGGRRTMAPWAPLRGRVINIGALFDW
jgi:iron complex outermembrane receptor protein